MTTNPNLWSGEYVQGLNTEVVLSSDTVVAGLWRVEEGIDDKAIVKMYTADNELEVGNSCSVTPTNDDSVMSDIEVPMVQFTVNKNICKNDFRDTNYSTSSRRGMLNKEIPAEVMQATISQRIKLNAANLERIRWSGDATTPSTDPVLALADGIIVKIQAKGVYDATLNPDGYIEVAATAITASNVIAEIQKVVDALPVAIYDHPMTKIVVSPEIKRAYLAALAANTALATWNMPGANVNPSNTDLAFVGYFGITRLPIYVAAGLNTANAGVMLAGVFTNSLEGNLVLATDALADYQSVQVTDLQPSTGQQFVNFIWSVGQGVEVLRANELVLYI